MAEKYSKSVVLLENGSATGEWVAIPKAGRYVFTVAGTFGGTSAALQLRGLDAAQTPITLTNGTFTAAGAVALDVPVNAEFRVVLTGGAPSAMFADMRAVFR